ncbi:hypothetical protein D8770_08795 [Methylobacterium sp. DB1607]|nr:hypothetical protein [Methylobacterium sp. DB1607]
METPDHTIHAEEGRYVVRVGKDEAGYVWEDAERPGHWILEDVEGKVMGQSESLEKAAAFLATWFVAEETDWI